MNKLFSLANGRKGRRIHRWVGLAAALYAILAVFSGLTHIVMANFYSPPPPVMPQGLVQVEQASIPITQIIARLPVDDREIKAINLRTIEGQLWFQILTAKAPVPHYFRAATGEEDATRDAAYARQIAADYLRLKPEDAANLTQTERLTAFNNEYLNIYRMLPVYRFDHPGSNGVRVYVSTITSSVTLYLNTPRAFGQKTFSLLHKFSFIPNKAVRDTLLAIMALLVLASTLIGLALFMGRWRATRAKGAANG